MLTNANIKLAPLANKEVMLLAMLPNITYVNTLKIKNIYHWLNIKCGWCLKSSQEMESILPWFS
jgi:hypothetical protein